MKTTKLLLFLMSMIFISCRSEDDDFSSYDLKSFIVGEWTYDINNTTRFTFNSNGKGYSHIGSRDTPFTWTLTNDILSVSHSESKYLDESGKVKILGKNKMQWGYLKYTRVGDYEEPSKPDNPTTQDYAPTSLIGKVIRFNEYLANGGGSTGDDCRIQFYTEHDMRANWASQSSSYTYTKTGKTTAHLNFICGQTVNYVTRVFQYDVTLTFTDDKGNFELKGTKEVTGGLSGNGIYKIVAKGSYWPQVWD